MPTYTILWMPAARADFAELSRDVQARVIKKVDALAGSTVSYPAPENQG